jgi:hypothetical protein
MIPWLPKELVQMAVETVCYFCTAVAAVWTLVLSTRR